MIEYAWQNNNVTVKIAYSKFRITIGKSNFHISFNSKMKITDELKFFDVINRIRLVVIVKRKFYTRSHFKNTTKKKQFLHSSTI